MKFYMSYWSGGYYGNVDEYMMDIHRLSLHLINKHYGECHLITDTNGKNNFSKLPFASITTELDDLPSKCSNWALGKLYAYKLLSESGIPFCHVDYDVFLWNKLPQELLDSEVFCQNEEKRVFDIYGFRLMEKYNINRHLIKNIPNRNDKITAYNVGIFGGNNLEFISKYANAALEFSLDKENQKYYDDMYKKNPSSVACISEQYYLNICSKLWNQKITPLFVFENERDLEVKATEQGYTHLIGFKNHPKVKEAIYLKLYENGLREIQNI